MSGDGREFQPGETVAGTRYVVDRPLARGGHGACYIVRQGQGERRFVMKILHATLCENAEMSLRMLNEGKKLTAMEHPNIVTVFDVDLTAEAIPRPYYVMEYLRGGSLHASLASAAKGDPGVGISTALDIAIELSDALDYAHTRHGVVHRDLKPENIFIVAAPNNAAITKLLDFSVMHMLALTKRITQRSVAIGTPLYMAPEQLRGEIPTPQTDLYALGVVLFELLTGRTPYKRSSSLAQLSPQILFDEAPPLRAVTGREYPKTIEQIVAHLLSKSAKDRPKSASWLASELRYIKSAVAQEYGRQPTHLLQTDPSPVQNMITMTRAESARVTAADANAPTSPGSPNARRLVAEAELRSPDATDPGMEEPPVDGNTLEIAPRALLGDTAESVVRTNETSAPGPRDIDRAAATRSYPQEPPAKPPSVWTAALPVGAHFTPPMGAVVLGDRAYVDLGGDAKSTSPRPVAGTTRSQNTSGATVITTERRRPPGRAIARRETMRRVGVVGGAFLLMLVVAGVPTEIWVESRTRMVAGAPSSIAPPLAQNDPPPPIDEPKLSAAAPVASAAAVPEASETDVATPAVAPSAPSASASSVVVRPQPMAAPASTWIMQIPNKPALAAKTAAAPSKSATRKGDDDGLRLLIDKP
jgi:serine/threonine protein kinase